MRLLLLLLPVACVPAPADLCRRGVNLDCTREFECQSDAVKASPGFQGGWGTSVEDCETRVAAQAQCDQKVTQDDLCTGADTGKHFDLSQASACSSGKQALSCADYLDPAKWPSACSMVCQ